jgi:hypothetical protein
MCLRGARCRPASHVVVVGDVSYVLGLSSWRQTASKATKHRLEAESSAEKTKNQLFQRCPWQLEGRAVGAATETTNVRLGGLRVPVVPCFLARHAESGQQVAECLLQPLAACSKFAAISLPVELECSENAAACPSAAIAPALRGFVAPAHGVFAPFAELYFDDSFPSMGLRAGIRALQPDAWHLLPK